MSCVHRVRWSVKRPEDCRFRLSVSHYKDRIVAPDEYTGATTITPSDDTQTIPTKDRLVRADVTVLPAPTEPFSTTENGQFTPSEGNVGFSSVTVDVEPSLESLTVTENGQHLPPAGVDGFDRVTVDVPIPTFTTEEKTISANGVYYPSADKDGISKVTVNVPQGEWSAPVLIYEGDFETATSTFAVTELPNGDAFSFDRVVVELSNVQQGQNVNKRTYWRSDLPMTGNPEQMIFDKGSQYWQGNTYSAISTTTIEDNTYISVSSVKETDKTTTGSYFLRKAHGGYDKITGYGWWSWNCPAGTHIKITGYNRTS